MTKGKRIEMIKYVTKIVAEYFGFNPLQFICKTTNREIINKRQIAQELSYSLIPNVTLQEIGDNIGSIGHDTIKYSIKTVQELCCTESKYNDDYNYLLRILKVRVLPVKLPNEIRDRLKYSRSLKSARLAAKRHKMSYNLNYAF